MSVATTNSLTSLVSVTTETTVDEDTAEALWEMYSLSFQALQTRAAARQLVSRSDFDLEVLDPRVTKYIARGAEGTLLGLATLSNDLNTVPWISPEFYEVHYPVHVARKAVYYCGIAMVHPDARNTRAFAQMVSAFGRDIAVAKGILAADMCRFNIDGLELARMVTLMMKRAWGSANQVELDRQVYMAWEPDQQPGQDGATSPLAAAR
jgi:hypothetical protein